MCIGKRCVSIGEIAQFFSGASKVPSTGFETTPKLDFTDEDRLPFASTCDVRITFPRSLGHLSYEQFEKKMDFLYSRIIWIWFSVDSEHCHCYYF